MRPPAASLRNGAISALNCAILEGYGSNSVRDPIAVETATSIDTFHFHVYSDDSGLDLIVDFSHLPVQTHVSSRGFVETSLRMVRSLKLILRFSYFRRNIKTYRSEMISNLT